MLFPCFVLCQYFFFLNNFVCNRFSFGPASSAVVIFLMVEGAT